MAPPWKTSGGVQLIMALPGARSLGDAIAELAAHIQVATYEVMVMIRQFDQRDSRDLTP
ncbi:MAG TPA: hypothetical protein QF572_20080 [Vicinamibacterales bacterium]|nr:hypothetical protein [Vicinamibacterales bacterium]HJN46471.1 hypothetical protein [Vicinamibacterales bacterium]